MALLQRRQGAFVKTCGLSLALLSVVLLVGINISMLANARKQKTRLNTRHNYSVEISEVRLAISQVRAELRSIDQVVSSNNEELGHRMEAGMGELMAVIDALGDGVRQCSEGSGVCTKVPLRCSIPLHNGMQNGSCVEVPLVFNGGAAIRIELRGGGSLDNAACTYSDQDLIHTHVMLGEPQNDIANAGALANWKGKGLHHLMQDTTFKDKTWGNVGKPITTRICAENERFSIFTQGEFSKQVLQWFDIADIRCMHIHNFERVSPHGYVTLSGMPRSPAKRDCVFSKCRKTLPPPEPFSAIDYGLFINLDHREDRKHAMEKELQAANITAHRIPGFNSKLHPDLLEGCWDNATGAQVCAGQIGCQRGHLAAIERAMKDQRPYVAIFEDDFRWQKWVDPSKVGAIVTGVMRKFPDWDAIGLSLNIAAEKPAGELDVDCVDGQKCQVMRVFDAQAPSGYILRDTVYKQVHHRFS
mmetsp:Transcript_36377/g.91529  ORF Transcript_36377/g.91529 Transcript_36377/m.91529 type:complete len:472 (+) Transcript_36377:336-1751(+)